MEGRAKKMKNIDPRLWRQFRQSPARADILPAAARSSCAGISALSVASKEDKNCWRRYRCSHHRWAKYATIRLPHGIDLHKSVPRTAPPSQLLGNPASPRPSSIPSGLTPGPPVRLPGTQWMILIFLPTSFPANLARAGSRLTISMLQRSLSRPGPGFKECGHRRLGSSPWAPANTTLDSSAME